MDPISTYIYENVFHFQIVTTFEICVEHKPASALFYYLVQASWWQNSSTLKTF